MQCQKSVNLYATNCLILTNFFNGLLSQGSLSLLTNFITFGEATKKPPFIQSDEIGFSENFLTIDYLFILSWNMHNQIADKIKKKDIKINL